MYFLIFQPEDMIKLCLNFNETQRIYAFECYKKESVKIRNIAKLQA